MNPALQYELSAEDVLALTQNESNENSSESVDMSKAEFEY